MYHTKTASNNIYVYSFSFRPEEHQPTGYFNMTGFEKVQLNIDFNVKKNRKSLFAPLTNVIKVFALHYNIFQVQDGMGAILFK